MIFILATTEANRIPVTILSRCQRYDFKRITVDTIADRLKELMEAEHVEAEEKAIRYIAKAADGAMRDALSLLDQCISFYLGETLTYEKVLDVLGTVDTEIFSRMLRCILGGDVSGSIHTLEQLILQGKRAWTVCRGFYLVSEKSSAGQKFGRGRRGAGCVRGTVPAAAGREQNG